MDHQPKINSPKSPIKDLTPDKQFNCPTVIVTSNPPTNPDNSNIGHQSHILHSVKGYIKEASVIKKSLNRPETMTSRAASLNDVLLRTTESTNTHRLSPRANYKSVPGNAQLAKPTSSVPSRTSGTSSPSSCDSPEPSQLINYSSSKLTPSQILLDIATSRKAPSKSYFWETHDIATNNVSTLHNRISAILNTLRAQIKTCVEVTNPVLRATLFDQSMTAACSYNTPDDGKFLANKRSSPVNIDNLNNNTSSQSEGFNLTTDETRLKLHVDGILNQIDDYFGRAASTIRTHIVDIFRHGLSSDDLSALNERASGRSILSAQTTYTSSDPSLLSQQCKTKHLSHRSRSNHYQPISFDIGGSPPTVSLPAFLNTSNFSAATLPVSPHDSYSSTPRPSSSTTPREGFAISRANRYPKYRNTCDSPPMSTPPFISRFQPINPSNKDIT